jgi:hypothetical protein
MVEAIGPLGGPIKFGSMADYAIWSPSDFRNLDLGTKVASAAPMSTGPTVSSMPIQWGNPAEGIVPTSVSGASLGSMPTGWNNTAVKMGGSGSTAPVVARSTSPSFGSLLSFGLSAYSVATSVISTVAATRRIEDDLAILGGVSGKLGTLFGKPPVSATFGKTVSLAKTANDLAIPGVYVPATTLPKMLSFSTPQQASQPISVSNSPRISFGTPEPIPESVGLGTSSPKLATSAAKFAEGLAASAMGMLAVATLAKDKYQRTYNWEMLLPGMGILGPEVIGKYIQEVTFGEYSIDEVTKLRYGAETRGHAGIFNIQKVSIKFFKPVPDIVGTYLSLWKNLIVDNNGFFSPKKNYALTGYLIMLDTTGRQSGSYKLLNMFPIKFPEHRLAYGENSIVSYTIDFNVDRIEAV